MAAPELNVIATTTDARAQGKPEAIEWLPDESQAVQTALGYMRQIANENAERTAIAQNQIQAILWQLANKYSIDLSCYEFNLERQGFVKKPG